MGNLRKKTRSFTCWNTASEFQWFPVSSCRIRPYSFHLGNLERAWISISDVRRNLLRGGSLFFKDKYGRKYVIPGWQKLFTLYLPLTIHILTEKDKSPRSPFCVRHWYLLPQVKTVRADPAGRHWKSLEFGSSIRAGKTSGFFRRFPTDSHWKLLDYEWNSSEKIRYFSCRNTASDSGYFRCLPAGS